MTEFSVDKYNSPIVAKDLEYSALWKHYDNNNNLTHVCLFGDKLDEEGNPIEEAISGGYSRIRYEYDNKGNATKRVYSFKDWNALVINTETGYCQKVSQFDNRGNETTIWYYDEGGNACLTNEGFFCQTNEYDNRNNCIKTIYYDINTLVINSKTKTAYTEYEYDNRNNMTARREYGLNGLTIGQYGFATMLQKFDSQNHLIEVLYFDENGNPIESSYDNCARIEYQYDTAGNKVSSSYYDSAGTTTEYKTSGG